jgi:hypothetical protein
MAQTDGKAKTGNTKSKDAQAKEAKAKETKPEDAKAIEAQNKDLSMAYMSPGLPHKNLTKGVGTWTAEVTMWMPSGAPPQTNKGTCVNTMILGGRYQQSVFRMDYNEVAFEGIATTGYDNALNKYFSTWIDNMGTGIMYLEGTLNAKGSELNMSGKMVDPLSGKLIPVRQVITFTDDNNETMEMFVSEKGKEFRSMRIKYSRGH